MLNNHLSAVTAAVVLLASGSAWAQAGQKAAFVYDDLDGFAKAHASIEAGKDPLEAMQAYVDGGTPGFKAFAQRFDITAEALAAAIKARPKYYARLARLKPRVLAHEAAMRGYIEALTRTAPPGSEPVPVYFLVGIQNGGGNPVQLPDGKIGIGVAIDVMAVDSDLDLSEFPKGVGGRQKLADIPVIVVHEMSHVYQAKAQGLANYRSIYMDGTKGDNLAVALREGCADYLTLLATGRHMGDRHLYGAAHEDQLWSEFKTVIDKPGFSSPGWFGAQGSNPERPDWPMQIGYWMGLRVCETYHRTATDKAAAMRDIYMAYRPEDFRKIAAPYAEANP